jgi:hypothetical protein
MDLIKMKENKNLLLLAGIMLCLFSCQPKGDSVKPEPLTENDRDALGPHLLKDNRGNLVISWTEKDNTDSVYHMKYAVFNEKNGRFHTPVKISGSEGLSTSPESAGKLAFKSDNTVIAVFSKSFQNEKSPFAGAIYYTSSTDQGKSWTAPGFLHSDTSHAVGRSFFDLCTLKNGEIAAVWLDGRFGKTIKGSGLFFAATHKGAGFGRDTCIYKGTCECCRTDIQRDEEGNIHIAWRSILFPPPMLGKQVRDMVYSFSADNGQTFSPAKVLSEDNWAIEGCPHTGPSLAVDQGRVNAVWYSAGGDPGIYYTGTVKADAPFQSRSLVSAAGKHPQLVSLKNGRLAMVCEESMISIAAHTGSAKHDMSNMAMNHTSSGGSKIVLRLLGSSGASDKMLSITDGRKPDHHAVIEKIGDNLLVAWVREEGNRSRIYYSLVRNN